MKEEKKISRLIFSCNAMTNRSSTIMPTLSQKNLDTPMKYGSKISEYLFIFRCSILQVTFTLRLTHIS